MALETQWWNLTANLDEFITNNKRTFYIQKILSTAGHYSITATRYFLTLFFTTVLWLTPSQSGSFEYYDNQGNLSIHVFWGYTIAALLKDSVYVKSSTHCQIMSSVSQTEKNSWLWKLISLIQTQQKNSQNVRETTNQILLLLTDWTEYMFQKNRYQR